MFNKSIKAQIAEKFGIPVRELKAVVYYSDRSWSLVTVFGSFGVVRHIMKADSETIVRGRTFFDLKIVPESGSLVEATDYGLKSGKILLVSGRA